MGQEDRDRTVRVGFRGLHAEDTVTAVEILRAEGWEVTKDRSSVLDWFLHIPITGARLGTVTAALEVFSALITKHSLRIRAVCVLSLAPPRQPSKLFGAYQRPSWSESRPQALLGIAYQVLKACGFYYTGVAVYATNDQSADSRLSRLASQSGLDEPRLTLRPFSADPLRPVDKPYLIVAPPAVTLVVSFALFLSGLPVALKVAIAMVLVPSMAVLQTRRWFRGPLSGSPSYVLTSCLVLHLVFVLLAWFAASLAPQAGTSPLLVVLVLLASLVVGGVVGGGVSQLFRSPDVRGPLAWVLPLALPLVSAFTLFVSDLGYDVYLGEFGLSLSAVSLSRLDRWLSAGVLIGAGMASLVLVLASLGWAHYFHQRYIARIVLPLFSVALAAQLVVLTTDNAKRIGREQQVQASRGEHIAGYQALEPKPVCVRRTRGSGDFVGNEPPTDHPGLLFGSTPGTITIYDPKMGQAGATELTRTGFSLTLVKNLHADCTRTL